MAAKELANVEPQERVILDKYLSDYPVKLGQLAKELGVTVKISSLGTGLSGQISREGNHYVIRVNRSEARERQRFTIGHELAHYLLHRHVIDSSPDGIRDTVLYRSGAPERIEYEANRLAADIVMPLPLVERELRNCFGGIVTEATIESLASRFEVSKAAMEIRLSTFAEA
ncbi:MAG: ImmA/IrrE family metallo-endopeptidase [Parvibaculum sp.]|uniref:ImmA/IrrE family metallo-endopeptidase n=1 Tax=Parvibaculum sp. TaxID=2024848 RepID=UPI0025E01515|nr:ImmA/IrrE family metallo-endopeptidase [Parvibaculum sp.]MCE9650010.1 ImmA/IrrE family metallo-endopeptidase [Parvibaculum sp.]